MQVAAVALALLLPIAAGAAERVPPTDYPPFQRVQQILDFPPRIGAKVSVFGYPKCEDIERCALANASGTISQRLRFDASGLDAPDRLRLVHCYDPDGESCIVVIYGLAATDRVVAKRIWWRSIE
jgi:hypothetical protein